MESIIAGENTYLKYTLYFTFLLGALKLIWSVLQLMYVYCTRRRQDLKSKYGREGAYAVVTGGSDGIGLELCTQLAS